MPTPDAKDRARTPRAPPRSKGAKRDPPKKEGVVAQRRSSRPRDRTSCRRTVLERQARDESTTDSDSGISFVPSAVSFVGRPGTNDEAVHRILSVVEKKPSYKIPEYVRYEIRKNPTQDHIRNAKEVIRRLKKDKSTHPYLARGWYYLAICIFSLSPPRSRDHVPLLRKAASIKPVNITGTKELTEYYVGLGIELTILGNFLEGKEYLIRAASRYRQQYGSGSKDVVACEIKLVKNMFLQGKIQAADELCTSIIEDLREDDRLSENFPEVYAMHAFVLKHRGVTGSCFPGFFTLPESTQTEVGKELVHLFGKYRYCAVMQRDMLVSAVRLFREYLSSLDLTKVNVHVQAAVAMRAHEIAYGIQEYNQAGIFARTFTDKYEKDIPDRLELDDLQVVYGYERLAQCFEKIGKAEKVAKTYRYINKFVHDSKSAECQAMAWRYSAKQMLRKGDTKEAICLLEKAVSKIEAQGKQKEPGMRERCLHTLGVAYLHKCQWEDAVRCLTEVVRRDSVVEFYVSHAWRSLRCALRKARKCRHQDGDGDSDSDTAISSHV